MFISSYMDAFYTLMSKGGEGVSNGDCGAMKMKVGIKKYDNYLRLNIFQ